MGKQVVEHVIGFHCTKVRGKILIMGHVYAKVVTVCSKKLFLREIWKKGTYFTIFGCL